MRLVPGSHRARGVVLLAPQGADVTQFPATFADRSRHGAVLDEIQRFRGRIYVAERNLRPADLSSDGRHVQAADYKSWHVLTLTQCGELGSCARLCLHHPNAGFSDLMVSHSALAQSGQWGTALRESVEAQIAAARQRNMRFAEIGGWAIARELRCTTEAIRMLVTGYALAQLVGGVMGVSTANLSHHSSSILRRMGARPLVAGGRELPSYYEPSYSSELEILEFDSARPSPRYLTHIQESRAALSRVTVICPEPSIARKPQVHPWGGADERTQSRIRSWCYSPLAPA